jgi:hypothetical protein
MRKMEANKFDGGRRRRIENSSISQFFEEMKFKQYNT